VGLLLEPLVLVESILQQAGYETLTASTLPEAQAIIHSDQPVDLVFTDISLGEDREGGLQVGQMIWQSRSKTPGVYTSGRGLTDGMKTLFVERSLFLPKPYTNEQLVEAVASLRRERAKTKPAYNVAP
jgi:DNA-binding NtrC family response regulator